MTRDEVVRLREAAYHVYASSDHFGRGMFRGLAAHVAAELQHYDHDGKPLLVDREWFMSLELPDDGDVCVGCWSDDKVFVYARGMNSCVIGQLTDFTRVRFLKLLDGLGIQHKGYQQ